MNYWLESNIGVSLAQLEPLVFEIDSYMFKLALEIGNRKYRMTHIYVAPFKILGGPKVLYS